MGPGERRGRGEGAELVAVARVREAAVGRRPGVRRRRRRGSDRGRGARRGRRGRGTVGRGQRGGGRRGLGRRLKVVRGLGRRRTVGVRNFWVAVVPRVGRPRPVRGVRVLSVGRGLVLGRRLRRGLGPLGGSGRELLVSHEHLQVRHEAETDVVQPLAGHQVPRHLGGALAKP